MPQRVLNQTTKAVSIAHRAADILDSNSTSAQLRPAGGVNHSDSDLVETGELSANKALRCIGGSILSNSRIFKVVGGGFPTLIGQNVRKTRVFPERLTKCVV